MQTHHAVPLARSITPPPEPRRTGAILIIVDGVTGAIRSRQPAHQVCAETLRATAPGIARIDAPLYDDVGTPECGVCGEPVGALSDSEVL